MAERRIRVEGHLDVPSERLAAVLEALPAHVARTWAEPGCLAFAVTPSATDPCRLEVRELFASRAALIAHQARTAASPWAKATAGIARHYKVTEEEGAGSPPRAPKADPAGGDA